MDATTINAESLLVGIDEAAALLEAVPRKIEVENKIENNFPILYMPGGKPAPGVMTDDELIKLLRLEGKDPKRTLKYYRDEGMLKGRRIGKKTRYFIMDVIKFLNEK